MATYRHKKLGWIAEEIMHPMSNYYKTNIPNKSDYSLPKELIENSQDRELVEEKDWISEFIDDFSNLLDLDGPYPMEKEIRRLLKKYAPKQKKFTEEEVVEFMKSTKVLMMPKYSMLIKPIKEAIEKYIVIFLKQHNLLSDTD